MEGGHVSTRMRSSIREEGDSVDVRLTHRHSDNRGIASTYFIRARLMKELPGSGGVAVRIWGECRIGSEAGEMGSNDRARLRRGFRCW